MEALDQYHGIRSCACEKPVPQCTALENILCESVKHWPALYPRRHVCYAHPWVAMPSFTAVGAGDGETELAYQIWWAADLFVVDTLDDPAQLAVAAIARQPQQTMRACINPAVAGCTADAAASLEPCKFAVPRLQDAHCV